MRQHSPGQVNRRAEVGVELPVEVGVGDLLRGSDQPVSGVGEDDVDAPQLGERAVHGAPHGGGIGDVQRGGPQLVVVAIGEIGELLRLTSGGDDAVAVA